MVDVSWDENFETTLMMYFVVVVQHIDFVTIFNRAGKSGAVLQTALSSTNSLK